LDLPANGKMSRKNKKEEVRKMRNERKKRKRLEMLVLRRKNAREVTKDRKKHCCTRIWHVHIGNDGNGELHKR
jgi:hypothetical protein